VSRFAFTALLLLAAPPILAQPDPVVFNRDIRPIMADTCFRCHGPDKSSRMANFRLDIRAEAVKPLKDGAVPIVPGDPDHSAIVQRIFAAAPAQRMPPQYAHKDLTGRQKETIRRWVAEGAVYQGHWAYMPVTRPSSPAGTDPIDFFIQANLTQAGLSAAPEADPRTLIRRVTLDLTGLLPAPAEVRSFEKDHSQRAYERLVDKLLDSPRYAEQQAMYWLDAVRYADTCGFHGDNIFPAWPYRDYVLNSFRGNKPFDQFTREQIAGDLIPNATLQQKIASAYNRLNRTSAEGGLQPEEYLAKYGADRVRTISIAWLGSTMGCAECHDHKFDPFLTKDFYAMKAFFADVEETGLMPDRGDKAWGTQLELPAAAQKQQRDALDRKIVLAKQALEAKLTPPAPDREGALYAKWQAGELAWKFQRPEAARTLNGAKLTIYNDEPVSGLVYTGSELVPETRPGHGLIVASGPNPDNETYIVTLHPGAGTWTALGLDIETDDSLPGNGIARGADRFVLTGAEVSIADKRIPISLATGDKSTQNGMPAMAVLDNNPDTGWGVALGESSAPFLALRFAAKLVTTPDTRIVVTLRQDSQQYRRATIGRFRLALSSAEYSWPGEGNAGARNKYKEGGEFAWASGLPMPVIKALKPASSPKKDEDKKEAEANRKALAEYFDWSRPEVTQLRANLESLEAQRNLLQAEIPRVVTTVAAAPRETRILPRGNWMDKSGAVVEPAIPEMFGKLETGGKRATRLDLANWIVSAKNPLTARAFVNRTWREFFGTGISKTLDDLGSQGEWPVNPELLDWLASEFMHPEWNAAGTHDWDVKHLIRAIVLSKTYRQSATESSLAAAKDPENRLLSHQSRFRAGAENIHDIALEVSGLLNDSFGGPSVRPYQPDGYIATLNFPKREYSASRGEDLYRRGVYTLWRRTFLHPSLLNFDAPTREECTVNRSASNTPLQALDLLNDPIFVEAARVFAEHAIPQRDQIEWIFEQALDREPTIEERRLLATLYTHNLQRFTKSPEEARAFDNRRSSGSGEHRLPEIGGPYHGHQSRSQPSRNHYAELTHAPPLRTSSPRVPGPKRRRPGPGGPQLAAFAARLRPHANPLAGRGQSARFRSQSQARHLPLSSRRTLASGNLRLQAEASGNGREAHARKLHEGPADRATSRQRTQMLRAAVRVQNVRQIRPADLRIIPAHRLDRR
jgi:hypothetical protein